LSNIDQYSIHDDFVEKLEVMTLENKKLKKYLADATTRGKFVIESKDFNNELVLNNKRLREEIKKLKLEKEYLATSEHIHEK
jgi:thiaminase